MNAVLTNMVANEQLQRHQATQRKNAESAYTRSAQYNEGNKKTLEKLEALLLGENEQESPVVKNVSDDSTQIEQREPQLGAGQVKQVNLPLGKTLEETIASWRLIRSDAISEPEPTTADYQLAAKASANIMSIEAQIALHNMAKEIRDSSKDSSTLSSRNAAQATKMQLLFDKAASSYAYQNEMKEKNFQVGWPEFYKSA